MSLTTEDELAILQARRAVEKLIEAGFSWDTIQERIWKHDDEENARDRDSGFGDPRIDPSMQTPGEVVYSAIQRVNQGIMPNPLIPEEADRMAALATVMLQKGGHIRSYGSDNARFENQDDSPYTSEDGEKEDARDSDKAQDESEPPFNYMDAVSVTIDRDSIHFRLPAIRFGQR